MSHSWTTRTIAVTALLVAWATPALAQNTRSLAEGASSPPATIAAVAWLEGRWVGEGLGGSVEEVYSPPVGDSMVGHFRASNATGTTFYELMTVREENGSLMWRLKHFHPDLRGWEEKDRTIEFPLVAIEGDRLYFDGLTIERVSENEVRQYVLVSSNGQASEAVFVYRRP